MRNTLSAVWILGALLSLHAGLVQSMPPKPAPESVISEFLAKCGEVGREILETRTLRDDAHLSPECRRLLASFLGAQWEAPNGSTGAPPNRPFFLEHIYVKNGKIPVTAVDWTRVQTLVLQATGLSILNAEPLRLAKGLRHLEIHNGFQKNEDHLVNLFRILPRLTNLETFHLAMPFSDWKGVRRALKHLARSIAGLPLKSFTLELFSNRDDAQAALLWREFCLLDAVWPKTAKLVITKRRKDGKFGTNFLQRLRDEESLTDEQQLQLTPNGWKLTLQMVGKRMPLDSQPQEQAQEKPQELEPEHHQRQHVLPSPFAHHDKLPFGARVPLQQQIAALEEEGFSAETFLSSDEFVNEFLQSLSDPLRDFDGNLGKAQLDNGGKRKRVQWE